MKTYANPYTPYGEMLVMAVNAGKSIKLILPSNLADTLSSEEEKSNFNSIAVFCARFYSKTLGKGDFSAEFFKLYEGLALLSFNAPKLSNEHETALGFLEAYCQSGSRMSGEELVSQIRSEWSNLEDALHGPPQSVNVSPESLKIMELGFAVIPLSLQFCPDKSSVSTVNSFAKKVARAIVNGYSLGNDNMLAVMVAIFTVLRLVAGK